MADRPLLLVAVLCQLPSALALERAGAETALPSFGTDPVFYGPTARYVVTVEAAGVRCAIPADFDGDGDLDLVTVSSNDNTVAWYERLADGSYGPKNMISRYSNGARIVTTGDIDQDNRTDVIVASYYDHTVGWFRNLGGSFGSMNIITRTALSAQGVSVADIDNDGDLDVLSASSGDNTVAWYENLGGGRFCEVRNIVDTNSKGVRTVIAADLNEDGYLDLAVASKDDNSITWYQNDKSNNFQKILIDDTATGAYSLVAKDVDNDGHLDLVAAANQDGLLEANGEGGRVWLYLNGFGAGGSLGRFTKIAVTAGNATGQNDFDWFVLSVWAGDLDLDGDVDIASASFSLLHQGGISWYENTDGNGQNWTRHEIYRTPGAKTGHYIFGADMDGDGDNDLVAVTNGDNKVQILTASTRCDNSTTVPRQACCTSEQYWNGSACLFCPLGSYLKRVAGSSPACAPCSTSCPRPGLGFQPESCHSLTACGNMTQSFARCDCGPNRYLQETDGVCATCPDGQLTLNDRTRTLADHAMVERKFPDSTTFLISDMLWNGFNVSRCQVPSCSSGQYFDMGNKVCQICSAGYYSPGGAITSCKPCTAGSFCPAGANVPLPCQAGNYSGPLAKTCLVSPAGFVTPQANMETPVACSPGSFAGKRGMVACTPCAVGTFAEVAGQSTCMPCGAGSSHQQLWTSMKPILRGGVPVWVFAEGATKSIGSVASPLGEVACTCDKEARATQGGECVPCEEGLECAGGPGLPMVLQNFHADVRANLPPEAFAGVVGEYSVFRCVRGNWCPGGAIGTCANGRTGPGCSLCQNSLVPQSDGACRECSAGDHVIIVFFFFVALGILVGLFFLANMEKDSSHGLTVILILITLALIMSALQQIGVFSAMSITWVTPIKEIIEVLSVFNLSMDLLRFGCVAQLEPLQKYVSNLGIVCGLLLCTVMLHSISVLLRYGGRFRERWPALIRTMGTIFTIFLIAIVHVVVAPFQCVSSPNGLWVTYTFPSVICGESPEHGWMIGIGLFSCILPLSFTALVCFVVQQFPQRMARGDVRFLRSFYFLVFRYRTEAFWYALVFTLRSVAVPLIPLLPNGVVQVILMTFIMGSLLCVLCRVFPWRVRLANFLDASMTLLFLIFICCASFLVPREDDSAEATQTMIAYVCSVLLLAALCSAFVIISLSTVLYLRGKNRKEFQFFICHHKAHAAAQARLLKILLQKTASCNVFIDSDNLENLDELMDIVRTRVEHLIVFLTQDTLTRSWCAGEIATATEVCIKITAIASPSFVPPEPLQLENLGGYLDLSTTNLMQYGITFEMVSDSYKRLLDGSHRKLNLPQDGRGRAKFESLVGVAAGRAWNPAAPPEPKPGMVIVSSSIGDDEATAAAAILLDKISKDVLQVCPAGCCMLADYDAGQVDTVSSFVEEAHAVIVVLSRTSLMSQQQVEVTVNSVAFCDRVVPLILPNFVFPSPNYYRDMLPKVYSGDAETATSHLEDFFHRIGVTFSINASDEVLSAQSTSVLDRIRATNVAGRATQGRMTARSSMPSVVGRNTSGSSPVGVERTGSTNRAPAAIRETSMATSAASPLFPVAESPTVLQTCVARRVNL